jgi:hypothetical protein
MLAEHFTEVHFKSSVQENVRAYTHSIHLQHETLG